MSSLIKKILLGLLLSVVTLPAIAKNTILVVGDSLSAAYGMRQEQGWAALLQQRLHDQQYDYQIINVSVSGDTTSNGLAKLPAALKQYQPAITIIALGGNDGLRGLPLVTIKKNLNEMIMLAKDANSQVVLVGVRLPPNYGPAYTDGFQQIFETLASQNEIRVVPSMLQNIDEKKSAFQNDGIHPTAAVQSAIMDNIWSTLKGLL